MVLQSKWTSPLEWILTFCSQNMHQIHHIHDQEYNIYWTLKKWRNKKALLWAGVSNLSAGRLSSVHAFAERLSANSYFGSMHTCLFRLVALEPYFHVLCISLFLFLSHWKCHNLSFSPSAGSRCCSEWGGITGWPQNTFSLVRCKITFVFDNSFSPVVTDRKWQHLHGGDFSCMKIYALAIYNSCYFQAITVQSYVL